MVIAYQREEEGEDSDTVDLFGMANLSTRMTDLSYPIWISHKDGNVHGARVKIYPEGYGNEKPNFSISISDNPEVKVGKVTISSRALKSIKEFIVRNNELLMCYWVEVDMPTDELIDSLV